MKVSVGDSGLSWPLKASCPLKYRTPFKSMHLTLLHLTLKYFTPCIPPPRRRVLPSANGPLQAHGWPAGARCASMPFASIATAKCGESGRKTQKELDMSEQRLPRIEAPINTLEMRCLRLCPHVSSVCLHLSAALPYGWSLGCLCYSLAGRLPNQLSQQRAEEEKTGTPVTCLSLV